MKGEKDEGKRMVPMFPGLHINDGDKGGSRAPPRNKMALFEEYNSLSCENSKIESRSRPMLPGSFASQASSSSNVAGAKRKLHPLFTTTNECPHSAKWYYPSSSTSPMMKAKCISVKPPRGFSSHSNFSTHNPGDENDLPVLPFLQPGKALDRRDLQLCLDKEKVAAFNPISSGKVCDSRFKLPNETKSEDWTKVHDGNAGEENTKVCREDCVVSEFGITVKKEELSATFMDGSIPDLNLTTDEVVRVIGQRLFLKARKTMIHQQKVFSLQIFELHRLITVQRRIARLPEILHEIKFPPISKLLYVSPLDTSASAAKTEADPIKPDRVSDCRTEPACGLLPLPLTNIDKHLPQPLAPKPLSQLPNPASWCFPPPPGNQWLIPVRSPSEGLVYKPYPGPCLPTVGFVGPVYGNCGPLTLSSLGGPGTAYGVPAPNELGTGGLYGTEPGPNYLRSYPMPAMNAGSSKAEAKPMIGVQDCGGSSHSVKETDGPGSPDPEPVQRDALSLFPTTPSFLKDQKDEQRVEVIKVVPHNRNSAQASAARIFQSIQEERRKYD